MMGSFENKRLFLLVQGLLRLRWGHIPSTLLFHHKDPHCLISLPSSPSLLGVLSPSSQCPLAWHMRIAQDMFSNEDMNRRKKKTLPTWPRYLGSPRYPPVPLRIFVTCREDRQFRGSQVYLQEAVSEKSSALLWGVSFYTWPWSETSWMERTAASSLGFGPRTGHCVHA